MSPATKLMAALTRLIRCPSCESLDSCSSQSHPHTLEEDVKKAPGAVGHPNVAKCVDRATVPPYMMVTEFCPGGSLESLLHDSTQELSTLQRAKILLDIASGMKYLNEQSPDTVRGTLTSSTVLLTTSVTSEEQAVCAKVVDFGLWIAEDRQATQAFDESWRWHAPEVFEMEDDVPVYTESADVFSFAMVMYEMFARRKPYADRFPEDEVDPRAGLGICMGLRPVVSDLSCDIPSELKQMMEQCWVHEAALRPTFADLEVQLDALYVSLCSERSHWSDRRLP